MTSILEDYSKRY